MLSRLNYFVICYSFLFFAETVKPAGCLAVNFESANNVFSQILLIG